MNTRGPDARRATASAVTAHTNRECAPDQQHSHKTLVPIATIVNHVNGARQLLKLVPAVCDPEHNTSALLRSAERNLHSAVRLLVEPPEALELEELRAGDALDELEAWAINVLLPELNPRWSVTAAGRAALEEDANQLELVVEDPQGPGLSPPATSHQAPSPTMERAGPHNIPAPGIPFSLYDPRDDHGYECLTRCWEHPDVRLRWNAYAAEDESAWVCRVCLAMQRLKATP